MGVLLPFCQEFQDRFGAVPVPPRPSQAAEELTLTIHGALSWVGSPPRTRPTGQDGARMLGHVPALSQAGWVGSGYTGYMVGVVAVMYLLGGVLPILGLGLVVRNANRRHAELDADLRKIDEIGHRPENISIDNFEATQKAMRAVREPQLRYYYRVEYAFEFADR